MRENERGWSVERIKVNPLSQIKSHLGTFRQDDMPKGYSIQVDADGDAEDFVTTEIISYTTAEQTKIFLFALNSGDWPAYIEVRELP